MSISSVVLELWQFTFIRDSTEIQKLEISPSEFCPISGGWGKLRIPNLPWMAGLQFLPYLSYFRKSNRGEENPHPLTQIRVNKVTLSNMFVNNFFLFESPKSNKELEIPYKSWKVLKLIWIFNYIFSVNRKLLVNYYQFSFIFQVISHSKRLCLTGVLEYYFRIPTYCLKAMLVISF